VYVGQFCSIQGAIKQASDVGTAIFALIIAVHTFLILFLRWQIRTYVLWLTLVAAWSGIAAIVLAGPTQISSNQRGPFFGISGYWCWITGPYSAEHITLDYMFMFMSSTFSFILYLLVFLRLRGNIVLSGWYIAFRTVNKSKNAIWRGRNFADDHMMTIARQMMLYPVAYTITILPISVARFCGWRGRSKVPFAVTIFCDVIFLLSGMVNVTLFVTTRRVLPAQSIIPRRFVISRPKLTESFVQSDTDAFYQDDPMEKQTEASGTSILQRPDSDNGTDLSIPKEHGEEPVRHA